MREKLAKEVKKTKKKLVSIQKLQFDKEIYPRFDTNWQTVYQYAQAMKSGSEFPSIVVGLFERKHFVVDGWHRIKAKKLLKEKYIDAIVKKFDSKKDMFVEAVRLNAIHGKQLSVRDKVRIVDKLQGLDFKLNQISEIVKIPVDKIERLTARTITMPNGSKIYLKGMVAKALQKADIDAKNLEIDQEDLGAPSVKNLLEQLIALLESNVYPFEDKTVQSLTVKLFDLLSERLKLVEAS